MGVRVEVGTSVGSGSGIEVGVGGSVVADVGAGVGSKVGVEMGEGTSLTLHDARTTTATHSAISPVHPLDRLM